MDEFEKWLNEQISFWRLEGSQRIMTYLNIDADHPKANQRRDLEGIVKADHMVAAYQTAFDKYREFKRQEAEK